MSKKDFDERLKILGLSRHDFCKMTGFAYSSVSNWNDKNKPVPSWVGSWLENYEKALAFDELLRIFTRFKGE